MTPRTPASIPGNAEGWQGINTGFGKLYSGSDDTLSLYERQRTLAALLKASDGKYVVLPETVAGFWSDLTESLWDDTTDNFRMDGRTYFVGAEIYKEGIKKYYNAVQVRGQNNDTVKQRYPVPLSMWRPLSDTGAIADWFSAKHGITIIDGKRVAVLICYEPYLYYPSLVTMILGNPEIIVAVSNSWWCKNTNLPYVSDKSVDSWGLLYGIPVVTAKNM
jgi:apolipoprotein N-acyltransferase